MPTYRIHRIKDGPREHFRWAAHTGGLAVIKLKDYDLGQQLDAATPYAAWKALASQTDSLRPGDLLELVTDDGSLGPLLIAKYIGFEPAQWYLPELKFDVLPTPLDAPISAQS